MCDVCNQRTLRTTESGPNYLLFFLRGGWLFVFGGAFKFLSVDFDVVTWRVFCV